MSKAQAAAAMRMRAREGISLKAAWAKVKGGRTTTGKGKGGRGGSRTRYARAAGFLRRHKWTIPSIGGGVLILAAARRFGWFQAGAQLLNGDFAGAGNTLVSNASVGNLIPIAAGGIALTVARQVVGPVPITKIGKWQLRAI